MKNKILYIIIFWITILISFFIINNNKNKWYIYTATDEAIDTVDWYIPWLKQYCEEKWYKINDISCHNKKLK